jgi:hypothetical protein
VSTSNFPEVIPVERRPAYSRHVERPTGNGLVRFFGGLFGWLWRIAVGAVLCFNAPVLSFFTSIAVVGWLYRWMQGLVLRGWWKQSKFRHDGSFHDFCESLGKNAPTTQPRWFVQERLRHALSRPAPDGSAPGLLRRFPRMLRVPWHSFWVNFKLGVQALFCTYLATGWGCLIMLMSWEFGWLNSFHKGYEQAFTGILTGLFGSLLFILAMFYVPMAQVHQAATGEARAFFHFRFVCRLIQSRPTAYLGLAALTGLASLILEIMRLFTVSEDFLGNVAATDAEGLQILTYYFLGCALGLFVLLLFLRWLATAIYRSAVLKALRQGRLTRDELHPLLARWLNRLEMMPVPLATVPGLGQAVRVTTRWSYRRFVYALLFLVWLIYVVRFCTGYFFAADGLMGFLNHPLVQFPCFDYVPGHLYQ